VRITRASRIVEECEGDRAPDRTADRALDHAGAARYSAADVETPHRRALNRERSRGAGHSQANRASVDGFNRPAQELSVLRTIFLSIRLWNPDANARSRLHLGRELRDGEARYAEEKSGGNEKAHH
jgi:hypothetical protein